MANFLHLTVKYKWLSNIRVTRNSAFYSLFPGFCKWHDNSHQTVWIVKPPWICPICRAVQTTLLNIDFFAQKPWILTAGETWSLSNPSNVCEQKNWLIKTLSPYPLPRPLHCQHFCTFKAKPSQIFFGFKYNRRWIVLTPSSNRLMEVLGVLLKESGPNCLLLNSTRLFVSRETVDLMPRLMDSSI